MSSLLLVLAPLFIVAARPYGNAPVIMGFTPATGQSFSTVTITGSYFTGATAVKFNGMSAYGFTVVSDTEIRAQAPANLTAGPISVTTPDGTATSSLLFIPPAQITAFAPERDYVGTSISITGLNLVQVSLVTFNGVAALFTPVSATEVRAVVPATATTGRIRVTTPAGTAISPYAYTVRTTLSTTGLAPGPNTHQAPLNTAVTVPFSSPITAATAAGMRVFGAWSRGLRPGVLSGGGSSSLTFVPAQPFLPGEQVSVTLPASLRNAAGVALNPRVSQFVTAVGGSGRGALTPAQTTNIGGSEARLAVGDLDNDGDADLVVSRSYGRPFVYLNDGAGHYVGGSIVPTLGAAQDVALGDVDGDGDLDLVASNANSNLVRDASVCLNDGTGTFTYSSPIAVPPISDRVLLGDLDADGDLDLLVSFIPSTYFNGQVVAVRLNDGTGHFSGTGEIPTGLTTGMVLGDVDNDSDLDLVALLDDSAAASIWKNDGTGTFTGLPQLYYNFQTSVGQSPMGAALGDLDGDGDLDLVTANHGSINTGSGSNIGIRLNNGAGVFSGTTNTALGDIIHQLALGDLDADGDLDLVVSVLNYTAPSVVVVLLNNGQGHFSTLASTTVGVRPNSVALADLDGDNDLDVVAGTWLPVPGASQPTNGVQVLLNQPRTTSAAVGAGQASQLAVFPNPAHRAFTVRLPTSLGAGPVQLELINGLGQAVLTRTYPAGHGAEFLVTSEGFAPGLYQLRLRCANQLFVKKLVLER